MASCQEIALTAFSSSFASMPEAKVPPTSAPMLVPTMQSIGMRISSSTLRTPTCAAPFAPPPPSTRPMRGRAWVAWTGGAASIGTRLRVRPRSWPGDRRAQQRRQDAGRPAAAPGESSLHGRISCGGHAVNSGVSYSSARPDEAARASRYNAVRRRLDQGFPDGHQQAGTQARPLCDGALSRHRGQGLQTRELRSRRHAALRRGGQAPRPGGAHGRACSTSPPCRTSSTHRTAGRCCSSSRPWMPPARTARSSTCSRA